MSTEDITIEEVKEIIRQDIYPGWCKLNRDDIRAINWLIKEVECREESKK